MCAVFAELCLTPGLPTQTPNPACLLPAFCHRSRGERQRQAEVIREALALARSAAQLMAPVARRRLDREQRAGGLVIALALYGEEAAVLQAAKEAPQRWRGAQLAAQEQQQTTGAQAAAEAVEARQPQPQSQPQPSPFVQQQEQGPQPLQGGGSQAVAEQQQPAAGGVEVPPAVADVTVAVQYMAEGSKVAFHKGGCALQQRQQGQERCREPGLLAMAGIVSEAACAHPPAMHPGVQSGPIVTCATQPLPLSCRPLLLCCGPCCLPLSLRAGYPKSGLMGFCDPSPAATKLLLVYYTFKVRQGGRAGHSGEGPPSLCVAQAVRLTPPCPTLPGCRAGRTVRPSATQRARRCPPGAPWLKMRLRPSLCCSWRHSWGRRRRQAVLVDWPAGAQQPPLARRPALAGLKIPASFGAAPAHWIRIAGRPAPATPVFPVRMHRTAPMQIRTTQVGNNAAITYCTRQKAPAVRLALATSWCLLYKGLSRDLYSAWAAARSHAATAFAPGSAFPAKASTGT